MADDSQNKIIPCFNIDYNPVPIKVWSRSSTPQFDMSYNDFLMQRKVSALAHRQNAGNLTKNQQFAKIATSAWINNRTVWDMDTPKVCPSRISCLPASNSGVPGNTKLCSLQIKPIFKFNISTPSKISGNFPDGYPFN